MATSLMLKDGNERIAGYVLLLEERLLARMSGTGEEATLTVFSQANSQTEFLIVCNSREQELPYHESGVSAACVSREGGLIAATSPAAWALFQKMRAIEEKNGENCVQKCKKEADESVYTERKAEEIKAQSPCRSCMQGRWPPPPCWPTARYTDGVWTEGGA